MRYGAALSRAVPEGVSHHGVFHDSSGTTCNQCVSCVNENFEAKIERDLAKTYRRAEPAIIRWKFECFLRFVTPNRIKVQHSSNTLMLMAMPWFIFVATSIRNIK